MLSRGVQWESLCSYIEKKLAFVVSWRFKRGYTYLLIWKGNEPEPGSSDTIQLCKCTLENKLHAHDLAEMLSESERCVRVHMDAGMQKQMHWTLSVALHKDTHRPTQIHTLQG